MEISTYKHPCFSSTAHHQYGRIHLPIAPKCNLQCKYCNRKYDCANESRPGVTSVVLNPRQAMDYLGRSLEVNPNITVAAIAGPGDAFANPDETLETLRLMREKYPELIACLSTNGLNLNPYLQEIYDLGIRYLTITINGYKPEVVSQVYQWIRFNKRTYRGQEAAEILISQQMEALERAKALGITVKINSVILPTINDQHIPELAKLLSSFHVDRMNCIPVQQNENDFFKTMIPPSEEEVKRIRKKVEPHLPVMSHCRRCRSDAAGLLDEDQAPYQKILSDIQYANPDKPCVAVSTQEGLLINAHLGEAGELMIFKRGAEGFEFKESRETPPKGLADGRWNMLAETLSDCSDLLVSGIGKRPKEILTERGIAIHEVMGFIDENLAALFKGDISKQLRVQRDTQCGEGCGGTGTGCCA